ncbi:transport permease protein [Thiomicrorhabdus immobilis]|uniref:Transport permease protein n=1 Tax=Thiomicrorhabdus immobilis TaxID=2791037 RepID=A0ABN6CUT8_9GAMM|nr:ABC transporter permease [Thiomicrorhabdus immobilis]BCN92736.1 transport permease protein [Thiomicrorhabdus immobilis]
MQQRTSWQVTKSVWYALFMREMLSRVMTSRYAWFWLLAEPVIFILVMMSIRLFIRGGETVAGSDRVTWLILGLTAFFMFRDSALRAMAAITANKGLFGYRQVKPIDTVFVRIFVEGFLRTIVLITLLIIFGLIGQDVIPIDPLGVMVAWTSVFLLGAGAGVLFSMLAALIPGIDKGVRMMTMPLLLLSGVIFPINNLPVEVQHYLLYNPVLHSLELLREAFLKGYWTISGVSYLYLYYWVLGMLLFGLSLYLRYPYKVKPT